MDKQKALKIFDLPPTFTEKELKQAWRILAKEYHPDISNDANKFIELKKAHDFLKDYRMKYPTEEDWENLFKHDFIPEYSSNFEDIWVTSDGRFMSSDTEKTILFIALFFSIIALIFIFIQITENYFIHVLWYQLSLGAVSISSSVSVIKLLIFFKKPF